MYSVNVLAGRLGHEVELNFTQKRTPVCTLRVSETRRAKTDDDHWENVAVWHRLTAWGRLAERVSKVFRKGSLGLFHFRIDYTKAIMKKENGDEFESRIPNLTLVDFEPLADFGRRSPND